MQRPWTIDRAVDDDAADTLGAQLLRLRRKAEERIDLAVDEQLLGADRAAGDPVDLRLRVDADIGGDHGQEQVLRRPHRLDADFFAGEVGNAADRAVHEQLEAADMNPGQHFHRHAAIDPGDLHRGVVQSEIERAMGDRIRRVGARRERHVADIVEPLGTQQVGDDILRGHTDALEFGQPHGGRFKRFFRGQHSRRTDKADRSGQ